MKKFMNSPDTVTDEELQGFAMAFSDYVDLEGHIVMAKDLDKTDRVTIVTYGGSGHEPAMAGFVGEGMVDVAVLGDIFAAPSGKVLFEGIKKADKGHGVLLHTYNYAGDVLSGKQALKLAKEAGINVAQVITGEEIMFDPDGEDNKRGLAGAVGMYHIAAAAAAAGKSLEEVQAIAQRYTDGMASVTVKVSDATHPQTGMSFGDLGETDQMDIGAGQHGESGGKRVPMENAKKTIDIIADPLINAAGIKSGDKAFVMINGCGATTLMEMYILYKEAVENLKSKGIEVVANMVGEILTVQEAAGFQMNVAKMDDEFIKLWATPASTANYWKK